MVFDFDDAIFVPYVSPTYGQLPRGLKFPSKSSRILAMSAHVIAGNEYLASYARRHNRRVTILPTVAIIAAHGHLPRRTSFAAEPISKPRRPGGPVIGWIGSHSHRRNIWT